VFPAGAAELAGQALQVEPPRKKPTAHAPHEDEPTDAVHWPAAHAVHIVEPGEAEKEPAAHSKHVDDPAVVE
jgi:hypothetical protein